MDMADEPGRPQSETSEVPLQTLSLSAQQAAEQLNVDGRTVRRYIAVGIRVGGKMIRLEARQVRGKRGSPEWQIYQSDLDRFKAELDRGATEGQSSSDILAAEERQGQALSTSIQIISEELERRSVALAEAQATIEQLALEAGRQAGRSEELERQLEIERQRVKDLEEERDHWREKAQEPAKPHRIRLFHWPQG